MTYPNWGIYDTAFSQTPGSYPVVRETSDMPLTIVMDLPSGLTLVVDPDDWFTRETLHNVEIDWPSGLTLTIDPEASHTVEFPDWLVPEFPTTHVTTADALFNVQTSGAVRARATAQAAARIGITAVAKIGTSLRAAAALTVGTVASAFRVRLASPPATFDTAIQVVHKVKMPTTKATFSVGTSAQVTARIPVAADFVISYENDADIQVIGGAYIRSADFEYEVQTSAESRARARASTPFDFAVNVAAVVSTRHLRAAVAAFTVQASATIAVRARVDANFGALVAPSATVRAYGGERPVAAPATFTVSTTGAVTVINKAFYRDDFNTDRTDGWGSMWTSQSSPPGRIMSGVAVNKTISMGQASQWVVGRLSGLPNTDDVRAAARIVKSPASGQANDMELIIALRAETAWERGKAVWFAVYPGSCSINTADGSTATARATGPGVAANTELEFLAIGQYYAIRERSTGNVLASWTDDAGIIPRRPENRSLWMFQKSNYPIFQSSFASYAVDWIEYGDA